MTSDGPGPTLDLMTMKLTCEKRRESGPTKGMLCCGAPAKFQIVIGSSTDEQHLACGVHLARMLDELTRGREYSGARVWKI